MMIFNETWLIQETSVLPTHFRPFFPFICCGWRYTDSIPLDYKKRLSYRYKFKT